jgi:hypothetical protein
MRAKIAGGAARAVGGYLCGSSLFGAMLTVFAGPALACAICFAGHISPIGQQIDAADAVVLAKPLAANGPYQVVEVIKGSSEAPEFITDVFERSAFGVADDHKPLLILRNKLSHHWSSVGAIGVEQAVWLRLLVGTASMAPGKSKWPVTWDTATAGAEDWPARLAVVAPQLESTDPLAAEIAYGELARAPYAVLRSLHGSVSAESLKKWLGDSALASRHPAYALLLGVAGGDQATTFVEKQLDTAWSAKEATNVAALIAADLELRGPDRVAWIEQHYLTDRSRSLPEIEAALLAMSVQGGADIAIPRTRIVEAYRAFVRARPLMAAFVVPDLNDWRAWGLAKDFSAILATGAVKDPGSQQAITDYLEHSPATTGDASIRSLAELPP